MSFLDKAKAQLGEAKTKLDKAVEEHSEQISEGLGKAAQFADTKTHGKYSSQLAKGVDKTKDALGIDDEPEVPPADKPL